MAPRFWSALCRFYEVLEQSKSSVQDDAEKRPEVLADEIRDYLDKRLTHELVLRRGPRLMREGETP